MITECPHCGCVRVYVKETVPSFNIETHYDLERGIVSQSELSDSVTYRVQKTVWCFDCDKRVGKVSEIIEPREWDGGYL